MLGRGTEKGTVNAPPARDVNGPAQGAALTIFGEHAKIVGKFEIADSIHVECQIEGELKIGGKLVVGQNGSVNATVETVDAIIEGKLEGTLKATGDVQISASGKVTGDIQTNSLVIAHGAAFNGNVSQFGDGKQAPLKLVDQKHVSQPGAIT